MMLGHMGDAGACERCEGLSDEALAYAREFGGRPKSVGQIRLEPLGKIEPMALDLEMTPTERLMLVRLLRMFPMAASYGLLDVNGWGDDDGLPHGIAVHICRLRPKIRRFGVDVAVVLDHGYRLVARG